MMERKQQLTIFIIGHSIHLIERLLDLLEMERYHRCRGCPFQSVQPP